MPCIFTRLGTDLTDSFNLDPIGLWLGRIEAPGIGPCVVTLREGTLFDITSTRAPTVRDIVEMDDAVAYVQSVPSKPVEATSGFNWLAPCDLQAAKAFGVTFSGAMVERVIKKPAACVPAQAVATRDRIAARIADSLSNGAVRRIRTSLSLPPYARTYAEQS